MATQAIISATDTHGGYSNGDNYSTEAQNGVFDNIATDYTGQYKASSTSWYVMQAAMEFDIYANIPQGSTIISAYIQYYHNFSGSPYATCYPYCYDLSYGTTWSATDKMTDSQLAAVGTWGTATIPNTEGDQTITYANSTALKTEIQTLLDYNNTSTSYHLRCFLADYRNELNSAPTGTQYAVASLGKVYVTYTEPTNYPLRIMMGDIA
jgi:hypothetical protein